jgi:hypothetical protein
LAFIEPRTAIERQSTGSGRKTRSGKRRNKIMEIKVYLLMALMSVIIASSHLMTRGTVSRSTSQPVRVSSR